MCRRLPTVTRSSVPMHTVNTTPSLKDLHRLVTPQYAIHWREIGIQLDLAWETLEIIENDNHYKAKACCNAMFNKWLQVDTTAYCLLPLSRLQYPAVLLIKVTSYSVYI